MRFHTTVGSLLVWIRSLDSIEATSGKSVRTFWTSAKSSLTISEAFDPENIGLRLLAEDIENDRYIESGTLSCHNLTQIRLYLVEYEVPHKNIDTGRWFRAFGIRYQGANQL